MGRSTVIVGAAALAVVAGCAHTTESVAVHDRVVVAVDDAPPPSVELPPNAFSAEDPVAPRPRLSRTITLGQGATEGVYGTPAPPPPPPAGNGANVTVNNHVTLVQPPVYYYGGYGGYGYGYGSGYGTRGFGGTGGTGGTTGRDGSTSRSGPAPTPWAPSGWEGAGRTAAPGATPGVGGNFAPPPSFGPRQMK